MIKKDLGRAFFSWGMGVAIIVIMVMFIKSMIDGGLFSPTNTGEKLDYLYIISVPMALSGFVPFACIFPVLPYGTSFCDDYNSGYLRMITLRTGYKKYAIQRLASVGISGGFGILIPFLLIFIIAIIIGGPCTGINEDQFYLYTVWEDYVAIGGGLLVLGGKLLLALLFGMVWSLVALAISAWIPNRYVTLIAPFILYEAMWVLLQGQPFNPAFLLRGDVPDISFLGIIGIQLIWLVTMSILFWLGFKRRMANG